MGIVLWSIVTTAAVWWALRAHAGHVAARAAAVAGLVRALAVKDPYTGEHTERVARYSVYIAEELGWSRRRVQRLRQAALLHDIGKLAVPCDLLNKPGGLTDAEFRQVQRHAHVCDDIIAAVDVLRPYAATAAGHHRRFDGEGYGSVEGRRGERSRQAAIVAVADAYDAMTSTRAYRRALPQDVVFVELRRQAGSQFDPACVAALITGIARRGERHGLGHECSAVVFADPPPVVGTGSAGVSVVLTSSTHRVRW